MALNLHFPLSWPKPNGKTKDRRVQSWAELGEGRTE